jgi:hypothetical protein
MADKEIAALSDSHLRGTRFVYVAASFAAVPSWLFAYYSVPETKGRTLEQIEAFWRARHRVRQAATRIS